MDVGSSFLPSEITAAILKAQLDELDKIQQKRKSLWDRYHKYFQELAASKNILLPCIPDYATNNAHLYYVVCRSGNERTKLMEHLNKNGIQAVFHYQSLHKSPFYKNQYKGKELPNSDRYSDCLLRLPLYYDLKLEEIEYISGKVIEFFKN